MSKSENAVRRILFEMAWEKGKEAVWEQIEGLMSSINEMSQKLTASDRLTWTEQVFRAICDHAREGGSYRHLIYGRLGFGPEAYAPLYMAGGMDISNHFNLEPHPNGLTTPSPADPGTQE